MHEDASGIAVHHVGITVTSLETSLRFWVDVLGFDLIRRDVLQDRDFVREVTGVHDGSIELAMLAKGPHVVELLEYKTALGQKPLAFQACDSGASHLGLLVKDVDALLCVAASHGWVAFGLPQTVAKGPWAGRRVVYLKGPDNVLIELVEPGPGED
ncbi:VOC family protein [Sinorhizobium sp. RAC02]|uniref:VOC family protein n=1 Tax=Sinorhizobium sp. RAC02 TaxID=1842534 RepID=UPI00083E32B6|nr:VOC family protein [Sinorhizobium sp. RAC02]AOF92581.1 glyoxalase/Bleomycin resistance /Dioxygenase superfamily protein [Sinorhizobium sp. RAC02]